jgi:uncharacterized SAM-binding protein YcdF (DUF218 family)
MQILRVRTHKPKRKWVRRLTKAVLLLLALWLWQVILALLVINAYGRVDRAQPADVIIVLGAGLRRNNMPGPALTRRAAHAAGLWHDGIAPTVLCTGGNPGNRDRSEADACAELLLSAGLPAEAIVQEDRSRSTEENALYSKELMDERGWNTAILVSDGFHLFRANHIFSVAGIQVYPSPVTESQPRPAELFVFTLREVAALHWQLFKEAFNIPVTYLQGI